MDRIPSLSLFFGCGLLASVLANGAGCDAEEPANGCDSDLECRRDRICVEGQCVYAEDGDDGEGDDDESDNDDGGPGPGPLDGGGDVDDQHGFILVELASSPTSPSNPFQDTSVVRIELDYTGCLGDFYSQQAEWLQDGAEGNPVFSEWQRELCELGSAECEDVSIDQDGNWSLTIFYTVGDDLDGEVLAFGPLPTEELAECIPAVEVPSTSAISGFDESGNIVWTTASFFPEESATDSSVAIKVNAVSE